MTGQTASALVSMPLAVSAGMGLGLLALASTILGWLHDLEGSRASTWPGQNPFRRHLWTQHRRAARWGLAEAPCTVALLTARLGLALAGLILIEDRLELAAPVALAGAAMVYAMPGAALRAMEAARRRRIARASLHLALAWAAHLRTGIGSIEALELSAAEFSDPYVGGVVRRFARATRREGVSEARMAAVVEFDNPVFDCLADCMADVGEGKPGLGARIGLQLPALRACMDDLESVHRAMFQVRTIIVAVPLVFLLPILMGRLDPSHLSGYRYDYLRPEGIVLEALLPLILGLGFAAIAQIINGLGASRAAAKSIAG